MKLFYILWIFLVSCVSSFARTWNVSVDDFSFNPSTINAVVGDVIQFNWGSGSHTTTCGSGLGGTTLPAGAAGWNSLINDGNTTFSYTVTVPGNYFYGCIPHFSGGFGMTGNLVVSGTVPVALGMFNVVNTNNTASITWKTFAESNTDFFSIRRSTDGVQFKEIGRLDAAGNSSVPLNYSFSDNDLGRKYKYLYYELVTIDIDKKESFSEIKVIKNLLVADKLIVALSPNPITRPGQMQIQFNAEKSGSMKVKVYSMLGKLVINENMAAFYGLNNAHLHVCDLQKGVYTIQFELDNRKEARKIVVQ